MNTVYTFSNGVHVDSSTIEKIKKAPTHLRGS